MGEGVGHDLSGQDSSLKDRESGLWVPAGAHREYQGGEEEEEEEEEEEAANGENRGREEERPAEAQRVPHQSYIAIGVARVEGGKVRNTQL